MWIVNISDASQASKLIHELQRIALEAEHPEPLFISIDQENGMLKGIWDSENISQFPGMMGLAATKSEEIVYGVGRATAEELRCIGFNFLLGPVVDVLCNPQNTLLGVRTFGRNPGEVAKISSTYVKGICDGGLGCSGKHFPGYGNAYIDSFSTFPLLLESEEQLENTGLVPFKTLIKENIPAILVGGGIIAEMSEGGQNACLSHRVVTGLLREKLGYSGVVISQCLAMEFVRDLIGMSNAVIQASHAGCDVMLICHGPGFQLDAIQTLIQTGKADNTVAVLHKASADKVRRLKQTIVGGWNNVHSLSQTLSNINELKLSHDALSFAAYSKSITLVRDSMNLVPLHRVLNSQQRILLLTPLILAPFLENEDSDVDEDVLLPGESVFRKFAKCLTLRHPNVMHTSYTDNGLSDEHESLLSRAALVILVTADTNRSRYQVGFAKHVAAVCREKKLHYIIISVSNPYQLEHDTGMGTFFFPKKGRGDVENQC